jgi:outer membrane protein assembly factor BamB
MRNCQIFLFPILLVGTAGGADWRQFRGSSATTIATGEAVPKQFDTQKNVAWKAELPGRGLSSPIVVGGRVFVTASSGKRHDRLHVLAFDAKTGRKLWQRNFWATGPTASHPKTCMAAPTPASDGRRLVALFATDDLICLDLDGNLLWVRALYEENPGATDGRGLASSPVISGSTVVVHVETQNLSFAAGIDIRTGVNRWKTDRPRELCWTSPILLPGKKPGQDLVLLQGSTRLSAVEPQTGREVWKIDRANDPISSGALAGDVLFVPGEKGLAAFQLQADRAPKLLWEVLKLKPIMTSPVVIGDRVYCVRGNILASGDVKNGKVRGQLRLKGPFSSSPVAAGGVLYCFNEAGVCHVIQPGEAESTLLQRCDLKETILGTPALGGGAMYVRSDKHLWKIAAP